MDIKSAEQHRNGYVAQPTYNQSNSNQPSYNQPSPQLSSTPSVESFNSSMPSSTSKPVSSPSMSAPRPAPVKSQQAYSGANLRKE